MALKKCPDCKQQIDTRYNLEQELVFIAHVNKQSKLCDKSDKPVK